MDFQRTDRQFRDRAADLVRSDAHDFDHNLSVFAHFVQTDPTLAVLTTPLLARDVDASGWIERILESRSLELPLDDDDRLALLLQLLVMIDEDKVKVLHIANAISWERKFDNLIRAFNDKFTRLVVRDLGERLRALAPPPVGIAGGTVIHTGAGSTSMIAIGHNIAQTVGATAPEMMEVLSALREAVAVDPSIGATAKVELSDDIDILERESRRTTPRTEIVVAVLESLAAIPGLVELAHQAASLLHVILR